ncbi:MAG: GNAT family N-acetyltransferase [Pseudomonadota bacterium]
MQSIGNVVIRPYCDRDAEGVARVFFDAVHTGTRDHYGPEQRTAWAGDRPDPDGWRGRLQDLTVVVADCDGRIVGVMTLGRDGLLDHAFVHPDAVGQGVGRALHRWIKAEAARQGQTCLHAQISLAARAFFERRGWSVIREQRIELQGVSLTNFVMEMRLFR